MSAEQKFYLEQGLSLLLSRIDEEDKVAIATYSGDNQILADITKASESQFILEKMAHLFTKTNLITSKDGIDLAYNWVNKNRDEAQERVVLLLRNNATEIAQKTIIKSVVNQDVAQTISSNTKLGSAIAITALSLLPELIQVIKN